MSVHQGFELQTQFSVFLPNKPGVLSRVVRDIAGSRVNILAISMMDTTEHGVLRLVVSKADDAREVLKKQNLSTTETTVLAVTLPNRPGAFAMIVDQLSDARLNIDYAYCTAGATGGKSLGIFKVGNLKKATKLLEERGGSKRKHDATAIRGTRAKRR